MIHILDGFVKSFLNLSFRAKREIFSLQPIENIRFLPTVEMTNPPSSTFYESIILDGFVKSQETRKVVFSLEKMMLWIIIIYGCARRGASGALFPKSALCGAEFPLKGFYSEKL